MSQHAGAHGRLAKFRAWIARAAADRRGVAAIEFALVAPLLLCMYFVTMEVSQAIETNKKVSRVGSMVADLVTQQQTTTKAELDAIMEIGQSLLTPYYRSKPTIIITAIEITDEATPKVKVFWSRKLVNGVTSAGLAKGTITTVPAALNTPRVVPGSRRELSRLQAGHHLGRGGQAAARPDGGLRPHLDEGDATICGRA